MGTTLLVDDRADAARKARNEDAAERTRLATLATLEWLLQDQERRRAMREAVEGMSAGDSPAAVCKAAVARLGILGLPAMDWKLVGRLLASQWHDRGDEYRVRCHVVALEEAPAGVYRCQGRHGQVWEGDLRREPVQPEHSAEWWWNKTPAKSLEVYSYGGSGRYWCSIRTPGKMAVVQVDPEDLRRQWEQQQEQQEQGE